MNDEPQEPRNMMEQVTGAFLWPWPKKPLGKPVGKGPAKAGKPAGQKHGKPAKGAKQRSVKQKKGIFAGWD